MLHSMNKYCNGIENKVDPNVNMLQMGLIWITEYLMYDITLCVYKYIKAKNVCLSVGEDFEQKQNICPFKHTNVFTKPIENTKC